MLMKLAGRLEHIKYENLPADVIHKAKIAILNYIGGSLPGADSSAARAELDFWKSQGAGDCVVLGHKEKLPPLAAAAVNGMMGQIFLQEDCHENSISHPGVVVIPTALALSQHLHLSGKELIEAIVCGYECQGKIGRCLIMPGFPRNGLRPASWVGPFGSVGAAAKLLKLDADGIAGAISVAANCCSGVMECTIVGSDDMCIHNSYSVKNGIQAAYEAKFGLRGAPSILEGKFGLGIALNGRECDWSALEKDDCYEISDTFVKIYPGCGHVLPTAQAAVDLVNLYGIGKDDVEKIVVGTRSVGKSFPGCDNPGPFEGHISAMMSHQFMVAAALCRGTVDVDVIKNYGDPEIYQLASKITVEVDAEVDALPESGGRVTVYTKDGRTLSSMQKETLPQTDEGVYNRMCHNGKSFYSEDHCDKIISSIMNLDNIEDSDELTKLLTI